jgi:heme/copper-type cytochrome/quinol oxidase subunit 2
MRIQEKEIGDLVAIQFSKTQDQKTDDEQKNAFEEIPYSWIFVVIIIIIVIVILIIIIYRTKRKK